ncbi:MAG: alcohol dehydrogenase catalytic domain-containing protein [Candidatus Nanopelagicaceae bacterium]|nr:alcohol dehydrogenase catalytic domain-containing protein [Candidatus Nanopelagicaceae bacterium]
MATMRAAVLHDLHDLRVEDVQIPTYGEDEVLIRVSYNGLCGTDATEYAKGSIMVPLKTPHPNSKHVGATILGHEFIGTVVEAGVRVQHLLGQRVACGAGVSCGSCKRCEEGRTNLCDHYYTLGLSIDGGLAEYVAAPGSICVPIPDDVKDECAALAQPLAVGIHGVRRANVHAGDKVIVLGVGAIGSFVCVALQPYDVEIIVMDIDPARLATATKLGADQTILIKPDLSPTEIRALYPAQADVVFETSGAQGAVARGVALTRMGGTLLLMGLNKTPQELVFSDPVLREVTIQTTVAHVCKDDMHDALDLLRSGTVAELLTEKIVQLEDVIPAFEYLSAGKATGKILVSSQHG